MQALVKTPRTDIRIQGEISPRLLDILQSEYGGSLKIYDGDEEYVELTETDWYRQTKAKTAPGDAMRIYRKNQQMTQAELGKRLGNVPRQLVSNMERGKRAISLATAKKLAAIFNVPASRFLDI
ncbi:helix-turn-helix transcriptional regulator [Candidatus Electrothrix sp.]|uniref:helix-turn-helix transcriptional regulator n=1 Tax=Candidatus Electrothrix sp. TaxID=2170559 RepID=UPI0040577DD7